MFRTLVLLAAALASPSVQADEPLAGYDRFAVQAAHRAWPIAASIWYEPARSTYAAPIGDNPVFEGVMAQVGAAIEDSPRPLVLLSHGSGGNMDALGWLSSALARKGAIVAAVNHQGSTTGDSSPRRSVRNDERAADLSALLDSLLADPIFAPFIDPSRISVLGFSLGGATALSLAGVRYSREDYARYCDEYGPAAIDCVFFAKGGVSPGNLPEGFEAAARDERIAAAIAVDPAFGHAAIDASLERVSVPVLLVNLGGKEREIAVDAGPGGSDLARRLPQARYKVIEPAHHFTFLAVCKEDATALLEEAGEDPICDDPAGVDRAGTHAAIIREISAFLGL